MWVVCLTTACQNTFVRVVDKDGNDASKAPDPLQCMRVVGTLTESVSANLPHLCIDSVKVFFNKRITYNAPKEPYVVNMCGKVWHCKSAHMIKPGVKAFARKRKVSFGSYYSFYTVNCNLHIDVTGRNSVFRAGKSSRDVLATVRHTLHSEIVDRLTLQILVVASHLGVPISLRNDTILRHFQGLPFWTAHNLQAADICYMRGLLLDNLDTKAAVNAGWVSHNYVPVKIMVNIMRTGFLTYFITVQADTEITENIEHCFFDTVLFINKQLLLCV